MADARPTAESRRNQTGGRVPPHNLQAEESLLGAMLLSKDAIAGAVELVGPDDFYKPAHGHIFDAITSLYGSGEPVDPVTVAEELQRAGILDAIGGGELLVSLQAGTPATSSAGRYAKIVEEHALLRRMIGVAGEIAERAYGLPDDVTKAIDEAESMVFAVAERRLADSTAALGELLGAMLDRLEQLYERGESITGIPTGLFDLDDMLAGLQPSALIVVGARPSMGKALSLDTPIPTPDGWSTMGDLHVGDLVLDDRGQPCTVTYATPVQRDRECYQVAFDDGSVVVADADHQWFAYDLPAWKSHRARHDRAVAQRDWPTYNANLSRDQRSRWREPRVVTTKQMLAEGVRAGGDDRPNWYVPLTDALDLPERELAVDPYVLGCWLGDGGSASSEMTIGPVDAEHFRNEFVAAGYAFEPRCALQWATGPVPGSGAGQGYRGPRRVLTRELQTVGLLGGAVKHIPAAYLRASIKQRLGLLQGLLDTDGCVTNANGTVELCLANRNLLEQAREVVCSLGHKPGPIRERLIALPDGRHATAFRFRWTPLEIVFRLPRKVERLEATRSRRRFGRMTRRAIVAIRPTASVPVRCITVDSPNHLYLAGRSMIPTHNTAFALGIASHAALRVNRPVLLFSLEMSQLEVTQRVLAAEALVDSKRLRTGRLTDADWAKVNHAVGRLSPAQLFIDDNPNITVMDIRAKARRLKSKIGDLGVIIIDYIQLMSGRSNSENRQVEVSEISRNLKILARELDTPVIALAQLNRQLETRADKRPMLADLRESGSIEQDADVVLFLYRDEVYNPETPDRGTAEVIVAKHRSGPTGKVRLAWREQYTRFDNMARGV
jgi:replicative DNA helicase